MPRSITRRTVIATGAKLAYAAPALAASMTLATQEADAQVSGGGGTSRCCEPCLADTDCTSLCPYCRSGLCFPCPPGQPCVCGIIP